MAICMSVIYKHAQLLHITNIAHSAPIEIARKTLQQVQQNDWKTQPKKFKSKWFRVAVAGDTTDGREIQSESIIQMAQTYNLNTYGARINLEHIKGVSPDGIFGAYGDVIALKTEKVTINGEQKDALFAQIQPNENLIALNQKIKNLYIYRSRWKFCENWPSLFSGTCRYWQSCIAWYWNALFAAGANENPLKAKKLRPENLFSAAQETKFEFEEVKDSFASDLYNKVKTYSKLKNSNTSRLKKTLVKANKPFLKLLSKQWRKEMSLQT